MLFMASVLWGYRLKNIRSMIWMIQKAAKSNKSINLILQASKALAAQVQTSRAITGFEIHKILKYDKYLCGFE